MIARTATLMMWLAVLAVSAAPCGDDLRPKQGWAMPGDSSAIASESEPSPYHGYGLPDGVVATQVSYREPGFRFASPQGKGLWEFRSATRLLYRGKPFAIVTTVYRLSSSGSYLACVSGVVVYDEHGNGAFERVEDINARSGGYQFHLPQWASSKSG